MKILFVTLITLSTLTALADLNLGQRIEIYSVNGKPKFSVYMSEGSLALTFSIGPNLLAQGKNISNVAVRYINKNTGEFLSEWISVLNYDHSVPTAHEDYAFSPGLSGKAATTTIKSLRSSALLIVVSDQGQPVLSSYIDLGAYCVSAGEHFLNLDTSESGCPTSGGRADENRGLK